MTEKSTHKVHPAPVWLTSEYVQDKLRTYFKDSSLKLATLDTKPAVANGGNYGSVMTRINVEYTTKASKGKQSTTFLVKTTFADRDPAGDLSDMVRKELKDPRKLFAATMNVDRERDSIIFEDMSLDHYKVACRRKKLDLEHTHLVLEKLALFHAASSVLAERQPGIFEKNYDRGFFNKHTRAYAPIMTNLLEALSRSLATDKELGQRYKAKIDRLVERLMDYGERSTTSSPGDFLTLAHGDLWTTNFMFQYDAKEHPTNAIFIDFQFSVWNSPAIDLHYFFSTSLQDNLRLEHQTELVQFYYYRLTEALRKLKYAGRIPSLFDFQLQFRSRGFYAVFCSLIFEPVMQYEGKEDASIEQVLSSSESGMRFKNSVYESENIKKKLSVTLPFLDQFGLLDDM
ncbi:GD21201 [Drosophila simulans]|uniref:GD21201 n=1 Tax=Drosophila simulans TaxID=7240 RepID=B4QUS6_DROSI|nr:GD21201 [Drosophila simulans]